MGWIPIHEQMGRHIIIRGWRADKSVMWMYSNQAVLLELLVIHIRFVQQLENMLLFHV